MSFIQAAVAAACAVLASSVSAQVAADRIWSGGPILTMNDKAMRAEAVAERGGKIVAVGTRATVMKHKGLNTKLIDLKGRALLPDFVDAHGHMMVGGIQALSANLLAPPDGVVKDIASLQTVVREWMAANDAAVKKVNLIMGFGYDNATLAEHRHPTRDDLDEISKDVPVMLWHQSGHMVAVNFKALEVPGMIREGVTVFALTAEEQRKDELMLRPDAKGDYAFSRAMRAVSLYSEFDRLPQFMQQPAVLQHLA